MTQATSAPVRKQIVVEAPQERAFTVFTENFGDFKPREHNIMQSPIARTVFQPHVGGHIVDVGTHDELITRPGPYTRLYGDWAAEVA